MTVTKVFSLGVSAMTLTLVFSLGLFAAASETRPFRARDFGVVGDGATSNTEGLQRAIDTCSEKGGGTVVLEAGRYVTGTLQLKDGVILRLEDQATLLGSTEANDYRNVDPFTDGTGAPLGYALVVAVDAHRVGLAGPGTIDGRGKELAAAQGKYVKRPFLVRWVRCSDVSVSDVSLRSSGAWTMHLFQSKDVAVDRVTIRSRGLSNNDGIDVDSCERVRIQNCDIDSGDDAICLKTTSALPCRKIEVRDCRLKSSCATLKLGTESLGDFEEITIERCEILGAGLGGIKLLSVDGAHLRRVQISEIKMRDVRVPVFIRLGARLRSFREADPRRPVGTIEDVALRHLHAENASQIGVVITGIPDHPVKNVTLEDVHLKLAGGGTAKQAKVVLAEKEQAYPEVKMFGDVMPAYGVYLRHAYGIKIKGLEVGLSKPDERPAWVKVDAEDAEIEGVNTRAQSLQGSLDKQ